MAIIYRMEGSAVKCQKQNSRHPITYRRALIIRGACGAHSGLSAYNALCGKLANRSTAKKDGLREFPAQNVILYQQDAVLKLKRLNIRD